MKHALTLSVTLGTVLLAGRGLTAPSPKVPTTVLRLNQPIPGATGFNFGGVRWMTTNHDGGILISINGNDNGNGQDFIWGSLGGGTLGVLETAGRVGPIPVTNFTDAIGGSGADLAYIAVISGQTDALIAADQIVASLGDTTAPGGYSWIRIEEPFLDSGGDPWFKGLYTRPGNSRRGLFRGTSLTPIAQPLDPFSGLTSPVHVQGGPEPGYDVSKTGGHWIGVVALNNNRRTVVKDSFALSAGGVGLMTGNVLPPIFQLFPNEAYNVFGQTQVCDADRWAVIGGTPTGFILRDGNMFVRPGNIVDGWPVMDGFRGIALNRHGGMAWIGRISAGGGAQPHAVFQEHTMLFKEGDTLDVDGDGVLDPGYTIVSIPGSEGRLANTEDGQVWTSAQITTPNGGTHWAEITMGDAFGSSYCTSVMNTSGSAATIQAVGSGFLIENDLRLRCKDMPLQTFGFFLAAQQQGFVMGAGGSAGDLCLGGAIGRFNQTAQIRFSGPTGAIEIPVDIFDLPQPNGPVAAIVGQTWNFQCWYRDIGGASNFSDGVEVLMQ